MLLKPLIIGCRKIIAKKRGIEYKPLFPKTKDKVDKIKYNLKNRKNGKQK